MITIWGRYKGKKEEIDQAETKKDAAYLVGEYQMAFGNGWRIWAGKEERRDLYQYEGKGEEK